MVSIIFATLAALGIAGVFLSFLEQNASLLFMLVPLGIWFFVIAPVVVWKEEREKVIEYERQQMEVDAIIKEFQDYLVILSDEADEIVQIKKSEVDSFGSEIRKERYNFFEGRRNAILQIRSRFKKLIEEGADGHK